MDGQPETNKVPGGGGGGRKSPESLEEKLRPQGSLVMPTEFYPL